MRNAGPMHVLKEYELFCFFFFFFSITVGARIADMYSYFHDASTYERPEGFEFFVSPRSGGKITCSAVFPG